MVPSSCQVGCIWRGVSYPGKQGPTPSIRQLWEDSPRSLPCDSSLGVLLPGEHPPEQLGVTLLLALSVSQEGLLGGFPVHRLAGSRVGGVSREGGICSGYTFRIWGHPAGLLQRVGLADSAQCDDLMLCVPAWGTSLVGGPTWWGTSLVVWVKELASSQSPGVLQMAMLGVPLYLVYSPGRVTRHSAGD